LQGSQLIHLQSNIKGYKNIKVRWYPGVHISNKKWVNDIAEATGNIKFARISAHTPAIYIKGYKKYKGKPVSRGIYFK
jgi:hypothetical protein